MKLIEANQAKEFASTFLADKILQAAVNAVVDNCPGTDIVHCKDCTQYNGHRHCYYSDMAVLDDDFCSYGERRTDGN